MIETCGVMYALVESENTQFDVFISYGEYLGLFNDYKVRSAMWL